MFKNFNLAKLDPFFAVSGLALIALTILLAYSVNTVFSGLNTSKDIDIKNVAQPLRVDLESLNEAATKVKDRNVPALDLPR